MPLAFQNHCALGWCPMIGPIVALTQRVLVPLLNVFLIEDSDLMQSALTDFLESIGGFQVIGAAAGETEATRWLFDNEGKWDVVTIDLTLQEGMGFNLIPRFKRQRPSGKVVVLSDFVTPVVRARCRELGADAAFSKHDVLGFREYLEAI